MECFWQFFAKGKWWPATLHAKWRCGRSNASLYSSTISISCQQLSWANLQTYRVSPHPRELETKPTETVFKIDPKSWLVCKHLRSSQRHLAILLAGYCRFSPPLTESFTRSFVVLLVAHMKITFFACFCAAPKAGALHPSCHLCNWPNGAVPSRRGQSPSNWVGPVVNVHDVIRSGPCALKKSNFIEIFRLKSGR